MQCQDIEQALQDWQPDTLPAETSAHLETCVNCRTLVADLEAIQQAAAKLGEEDLDLAPADRVWIGLRAQLEAEGLVREPAYQPEKTSRFAAWWAAVPRPALAAAYLSLLLVAALLGGLKNAFSPGGAQEMGRVGASADAGIASELKSAETGTVDALPRRDPDLAAAVRRDLTVIDNFIAVCEKSVREEPKNQLAREYLYSAYQQKAQLLSAVMERGAPGD